MYNAGTIKCRYQYRATIRCRSKAEGTGL